MVQTGRHPGGRDVFPCVGAVVSLFRGYDAGYSSLIPPYIVLDPAARAILRGRIPARPLQTVRHRRRSGPEPDSSSKASSPRASPTSSNATAASCSRKLNTFEHALGSDASVKALAESEKQAYELILGDEGKLFDLSTGEERTARPLRPQHVRAVVPDGAAAGRARRPLRHDQLPGLGHPQAAFSGHAAETAGDGQGHGDPARKIWPSGDCSTAPSSGGAANSAARRKSCGRPLGTAGADITARSFRPWSPAADSRAAAWSARPTPKASRSRSGPSILAI